MQRTPKQRLVNIQIGNKNKILVLFFQHGQFPWRKINKKPRVHITQLQTACMQTRN